MVKPWSHHGQTNHGLPWLPSMNNHVQNMVDHGLTMVLMPGQCVTSALFLGNMLRARKYLFALCTRKYQFSLCFRVRSNLYVKRSAYANVFKFNREKKHFERAKVNSRCFHWFPAAIFILNTIIFSDILCQITRVPNIVHPQNFCT